MIRSGKVLIVMTLIASGTAGMLWYRGYFNAWANAPIAENTMAALVRHHMVVLGSKELAQHIPDASGRLACIRLPDDDKPGRSRFTGLVPRQFPEQFAYFFQISSPAESRQTSEETVLEAFTLAGIMERTSDSIGRTYWLTWEAAPHIGWGSSMFCASTVKLGPKKILKTIKTNASRNGAPLYNVTYTYGVVDESAWLKRPGVRERLNEQLSKLRSMPDIEMTTKIILGRNGWVVFGGADDEEQSKAGVDRSALSKGIEAYLKNHPTVIEERLPACLPLPYLKEVRNRRGVPLELFADETAKEYSVPDLIFEDAYSVELRAQGEGRYLRMLAKHGILAGIKVSPPSTSAITQASLLGGAVYRVPDALKRYLVSPKNAAPDIDTQQCLRFANSEIRIFKVRFDGYLARGNGTPSYSIEGQIVPKNLYDWIKPIVEAGDVPEVKAAVKGFYFRGQADIGNEGPSLKVQVFYPESTGSYSYIPAQIQTIRRIQEGIKSAAAATRYQSSKEFLAGNQEAINQAANALRENPGSIGQLRGQCEERKQRFRDMRSDIDSLKADREYHMIGDALATHAANKAREVERLCDGMLQKLRDVLKMFPSLSNRSTEAQLKNDPPVTKSLRRYGQDSSGRADVPPPAAAPSPAPAAVPPR